MGGSVKNHRTIEFLSNFLEFFGDFLEFLGKIVEFLIKSIEFSLKIYVYHRKNTKFCSFVLHFDLER